MNMWTSGQRRWRKKSKRGVSPIIATILLVAITVVLAAVLYILISGLTKGPGNTPLGTSLAVQSPLESTKGTTNYYNFSVQSAGGGLLLNNLAFQIVNPSGSIVATTGFTLNVLGLTGSTVGTYTIAAASPAWTVGGTTVVSSSMTIALTTPTTSASLSGDTMNIIGVGSFSGSIAVNIP